MSVSDARAALRAGSVRVVAHAPERDAAMLEALAVWSLRVGPVVSVDPPDGLLLDVSGCGGVWGGEDRLSGRMLEGFAALGVGARAAIGPTYGCAWALARYGASGAIVGAGGQRDALGGLPVECLRVDGPVRDGLALLGVERVEQLMALPRRTLPARFGEGLLLRLDQALGEAIETIEAIRPIEAPRAERIFDGPTTQWEAIEWTVRELLAEVCAGLLGREEGATRVEVVLLRSDLCPTAVCAMLSRPSREAGHLWSILRPKLERAHLGFGVEGVTLTATRTARLAHEQGLCWSVERSGTDVDAGRLVDTLVARFGPERVLRPVLRASHIPERASSLATMFERPLSMCDEAAEPGGDRPTVLFDRPHPAEALSLTPDGPVHWLDWGEGRRSLTRCIGPERIGPEWWAGDRQTRDYFKVQEESGRWLWVYRVLASRAWFVHGWWA